MRGLGHESYKRYIESRDSTPTTENQSEKEMEDGTEAGTLKGL